MSLLLRIALHRDGAEKLVEHGVMDAFAECTFIDQLPEWDPNNMGM
jgi:hypothetical protein